MLSKNILTQRDQLEMVAIDQLVPQNQLVRKMETALNFSFIYDEVKYLFGRGSPKHRSCYFSPNLPSF